MLRLCGDGVKKRANAFSDVGEDVLSGVGKFAISAIGVVGRADDCEDAVGAARSAHCETTYPTCDPDESLSSTGYQQDERLRVSVNLTGIAGCEGRGQAGDAADTFAP